MNEVIVAARLIRSALRNRSDDDNFVVPAPDFELFGPSRDEIIVVPAPDFERPRADRFGPHPINSDELIVPGADRFGPHPIDSAPEDRSDEEIIVVRTV